MLLFTVTMDNSKVTNLYNDDEEDWNDTSEAVHHKFTNINYY